MANSNQVVIRFPRSVGARITLAQAILAAFIVNKATFTSPTPTTAQLQADIDALDAAETATKTKVKGSAALRNEKLKVVLDNLRQLRAYVQILVTASPDQALTLAESAGMTLKKGGTHVKAPLTVKPHVSGAVKLAAKVAKRAKAHEWQVSVDGGKTWTNAPPTTKSKTTIGELQTGVLTYFRHRALAKDGPGDWTQPVSILVA